MNNKKTHLEWGALVERYWNVLHLRGDNFHQTEGKGIMIRQEGCISP
jgi:hypothetical protein